jgi:hypothetical protein
MRDPTSVTDIHERLRLRARAARAAKNTCSHYLIAGLAVWPIVAAQR